jgi:hypothetical protein
MKTLLDIVQRDAQPAPWTEGDNVPWNDPDFSERMLAEHLSQEHDLASRRSATIDAATGAVSSCALSNEAYSEEELDDALCSVGFDEVQRFPSLRGKAPTEETDLPVVVARR